MTTPTTAVRVRRSGLPVGHADEGPVAEPGDAVREDPGDGFTVT